jgi:hypothetical protein
VCRYHGDRRRSRTVFCFKAQGAYRTKNTRARRNNWVVPHIGQLRTLWYTVRPVGITDTQCQTVLSLLFGKQSVCTSINWFFAAHNWHCYCNLLEYILVNVEYWCVCVCVCELPYDSGVSPQHTVVIKVSTAVYIRCAFLGGVMRMKTYIQHQSGGSSDF